MTDQFYIGFITGFASAITLAVKLKIGGITNNNEIGKIKGNGGMVDVNQIQIPTKKKIPFLKRIFTKKTKR